jgi:hypothetical protein
VSNKSSISAYLPLLLLNDAILDEALTVIIQSPIRANATSSTAAVAYSFAGNFVPGARGTGESNPPGNDATGGVGGAVIFIY